MDEISRARSFLEKDQACGFESVVVYNVSLQLLPKPEPTMQNNPGINVSACGAEKGGHHIGGALLPS